MGASKANISRDIFDEEKRYLGLVLPEGVPWVDADMNDYYQIVLNYVRRVQQLLGDGAINSVSFRIDGTSADNDFTIKGGGGTIESAARFFANGHPLTLIADVAYVNVGNSEAKKSIYSVSTDLSVTQLTDSSAKWAAGELVGRSVVPNVVNGTAFTITSNTETVITISVGDMSAVAVIGDKYRINLSTPAGGRTDGVYLNTYIDEIDAVEDPTLLHPFAGGIPAQFRLQVQQHVFVREDIVFHGELVDYIDSDGRQHTIKKIAEIARFAAQAAIDSGDVTDLRQIIQVNIDKLASQIVDLRPEPQPTPGNTVFVNGGSYRTHKPSVTAADRTVTVVDDVASAVTFDSVGADSRIDLLVLDDAGAASKVVGVQAAAPEPPAYPTDKVVIAEVTITEVGAVVLNAADIRDVRPFFDFFHGDLSDDVGVTMHDSSQTNHAQTDPENWDVATGSDLKGHLTELGQRRVWIRKVSEFGAPGSAHLHDMLDELYASDMDAGIIIVDQLLEIDGTTTVDGSKPLLIVGGAGLINDLKMVSGSVTIGSGGTPRSPVTLENITILRDAANTGSLTFAEPMDVTFRRVDWIDNSTSATARTIIFGSGGPYDVLFERCVANLAADTKIIDVSGSGNYNLLFRRSTFTGAGVETGFKRGGAPAGTLEMRLAEHSLIAIDGWGSGGVGTIRVYYEDGTSLLTGRIDLTVNDAVAEVSGHAYFSLDFDPVVKIEIALKFSVASHLIISRGLHSASAGNIGSVSRSSADGYLIEGEDRFESIISGSADATGDFIRLEGSGGAVSMKNLEVRISGTVGSSATGIRQNSGSLEDVRIVVNLNDLAIGFSAIGRRVTRCTTTGSTAAQTFATAFFDGQFVGCFAGNFTLRGFFVRTNDEVTNCDAAIDQLATGGIGIESQGGARIINSRVSPRIDGSVISGSVGIKLTNAAGDLNEQLGAIVTGCRIGGKRSGSGPFTRRLERGIEINGDGHVINGNRVIEIDGDGIEFLDAGAKYSVVNGNVIRDIVGDGIDETGIGALNNNFVGNLAQGVGGTDFKIDAASGDTGNIGFL